MKTQATKIGKLDYTPGDTQVNENPRLKIEECMRNISLIGSSKEKVIDYVTEVILYDVSFNGAQELNIFYLFKGLVDLIKGSFIYGKNEDNTPILIADGVYKLLSKAFPKGNISEDTYMPSDYLRDASMRYSCFIGNAPENINVFQLLVSFENFCYSADTYFTENPNWTL